MSGTGEDNSNVGRTYAHPKADLAEQRSASAPPSVMGRMLLAVVLGGFFGTLLSILIAPNLALAFALMGAMTFGAGAVALMMFTPPAPDRRPTARTEEEVHTALADIEARKK